MDPAPRSGCAINAAVEVLGDPWAILVLRDIMFGNRRHFRAAGTSPDVQTAVFVAPDTLNLSIFSPFVISFWNSG